jgi:hypothetical protein
MYIQLKNNFINIFKALQSKGLKKTEIAHMLGFTTTTQLHNVIEGKSMLSTKAIISSITILSVNPAYLFLGEGDMFQTNELSIRPMTKACMVCCYYEPTNYPFNANCQSCNAVKGKNFEKWQNKPIYNKPYIMKKLITIPTDTRIEVGDIVKKIKNSPLEEALGEDFVGKYFINKNPYVKQEQGYCEKHHVYLIDDSEITTFPVISCFQHKGILIVHKCSHVDHLKENEKMVLATTNPNYPTICTLDPKKCVDLLNRGISEIKPNIFQDNEPSSKLDEFLDKVDKICYEYGYEIHPTVEGWTGRCDINGEYPTIAVIGNGEAIKLLHIDGDGRGK